MPLERVETYVILTKSIFTDVVILGFLTKLGDTRLTVKTAVGVL